MNYGVGSDRHLTWIRQIEFAEDNLVAPNLAKEILEDLNRQLLTRTPSISKTERGKSGVIANREIPTINSTKYRPETAIRDFGLASVLYIETRDLEPTPRKADLLAFLLSNLSAGGDTKIPLRIKRIRIFPMHRIKAGASVRRADVAVPF